MDALTAAMRVAGSGLEAQSNRLRIVSENLANAQSTAQTAGGDPYQRKTISFTAELNRATGAYMVGAENIGRDHAPFPEIGRASCRERV